MTGRLSVAAFIASAAILIRREYMRARADHRRPMFITGTLHWRNHRPRTNRTDQE